MKKIKMALIIATGIFSSLNTSLIFANNVNVKDGDAMQVTQSLYEVVPPNGFRYCDASAYVQNLCNGKVYCQLQANDTLCGDPSPGLLKHLVTMYSCGNKVYANDTPEYGIATLTCENPTAIPGTKEIK